MKRIVNLNVAEISMVKNKSVYTERTARAFALLRASSWIRSAVPRVATDEKASSLYRWYL
jgi:hypothetical protein